MVTITSQILGKMTKCLFSLSKPIWLPSSPSIPQSLRLQDPGFHTLLPTLNSPAQGVWLHFPYRTQPLWFSTPLFCTFALLAAAAYFPLSLPSPSPRMTQLYSCPPWILTDFSFSGCVLPFFSNNLTPPPHLRAVLSFFFFFCIFFFHPVT